MAGNQPPKELATKKKTSSSSSTSSTKKTQSKTTKKATKTTTKTINKIAKKNPVGFAFIAAALIVGAIAGYMGFNVITKNDVYKMNDYKYENVATNLEGETARNLYGDLGSETAILLLNEKYVEQGVSCIVFGKNYSQEVEVKYYYREDISKDAVLVPSVDTSISGFYYACYHNDTLKYSNVELIRNIIVMEVEQDG